MKKNKVFVLAFYGLISIHACQASDDALQDYRVAHDALVAQIIKQRYGSTSEDDNGTLSQDLYMSKNAQSRLATLHAARNTQRDKEEEDHYFTLKQKGLTGMLIGGCVLAVFQAINALDIPPTSYYSDIRDYSTPIGNSLGCAITALGFIEYGLALSRLRKLWLSHRK